MLLQHKKVAIVGGGPGGLTLARLLQQQGIDVTVYERDVNQHARQQGTTLDMHRDTGLKALTTAGLLDEFKRQYRPGADRLRLLTGQQEILLDEHAEQVAEDFGDENFRPEIDRGPLRDMLVASLRAGTVVWNARFTDLLPAGDGWDIHFENGTRAYADLVVAADGASSKLRHYLTDIPAVYTGVTALEGTIPQAQQQAPGLWQLVQGGSLMSAEHGKTISFITKADGTLSFLIGVKKPENWLASSGIDFTDRAAVAAWFAEEFRAWSPNWQELFAPDNLALIPRPMYYYPANQHWPSRPNLTMLGDAAHWMPPYAGEGANQALADALDLYEALCGGQFDTLAQALASFEQTMRARMAGIIDMTVQYTEAMHADRNQWFLLDLFTGGAASAPAPEAAG